MPHFHPSTTRHSTAARTSIIGLAIALVLALGAAMSEPAAQAAQGCRNGLVTARGCERPAAVSKHLERILRDVRADFGLKAAIARVDAGNRTLLRTAIGRSQADVAARPRMHFRIGSMAIPWLTTIVLQLRDEGRLGIDEPISRWFPNLPRAGQVTVRMLATNTSGYYDYIQGYQPFIDRWFANPFKRWTPRELLDIALSRGFACDPGVCFNYAHTNYILLSRIVQQLTGERTRRQMSRRVLRPLGLDGTQITADATIPGPVLHGFTSDRGFYEDSTTWSPSWTLGSGSIATATIDDVAASARGILSGSLLSHSSRRVLATGSPEAPSFAFGLIAVNGWRLQNPSLNGYGGIMAYLPQGKLSIALTTTNGKAASLADDDFTSRAFGRLAAYLAPGHPTPWGS